MTSCMSSWLNNPFVICVHIDLMHENLSFLHYTAYLLLQFVTEWPLCQIIEPVSAEQCPVVSKLVFFVIFGDLITISGWRRQHH